MADRAGLRRRDWLLVLGLGLLVRLPFVIWPAFHEDLLVVSNWSRLLVDRGPAHVYVPGADNLDVTANYPPLYLYVLWLIGLLYEWVEPGFTRESALLHPIEKLPGVAGDLAIAGLLLAEGSRRWGRRAGLLAATFFALNPAAIYLSAFWGQVDCLPSLGMLAAVLAVERGWAARGAVAFGLGLSAKLLAMSLAPVLFVGVVRHGGPPALARALLAGLATLMAVVAPFLLAGTLGDMLASFWEFVGWYPWVSAGALNLQYLLTGAPQLWPDVLDTRAAVFGLSYRQLGVLLLAAWLLAVAVLLWRSRDPVRLHLAGALCAMGWFLLPTEVHERHLFPALPFLALLAAGDWRYRLPLVALSAAFSLNLFLAVQWYEQAGRALQRLRLFFSDDLSHEPAVGVAIAVTYFAVAGYLVWRLATQRALAPAGPAAPAAPPGRAPAAS